MEESQRRRLLAVGLVLAGIPTVLFVPAGVMLDLLSPERVLAAGRIFLSLCMVSTAASVPALAKAWGRKSDPLGIFAVCAMSFAGVLLLVFLTFFVLLPLTLKR